MLLDLETLYFPINTSAPASVCFAIAPQNCDSKYDIGQLLQITATVKDLNGDLVNPLDAIFRVKAPDGTITEYDALNPETGIFTFDLQIAESGYYYFRFEGSGIYTAVADSSVISSPSPFYPCCSS